MARMRETNKQVLQSYEEAMKETIERKAEVVETLMKNTMPNATEEQRSMIKAAIMTSPDNPAQGWNTLRKEMQGQLDEILAPAIKALEAGMGNAGIMDEEDEQGNTKTVRYSENAPWYKNFYKQFKRKPTKAELEDMAIALVTGDPSAPQMQGWIADSQEVQEGLAENKAAISLLRDNIKALDDIKGEMQKLTGVEMELTAGLSPEAVSMYRQIYDWAKSVGGSTARQARMGAILAARHADIYASIVTEKTGKNYTAVDYMREKLGFSIRPAGGGLNQSAMYLNPAKTFRDFRENVLSGKSGKSYFLMPVGDHQLKVFSDDIIHIQQGKSHHPLTDEQWETLINRLDSVEEVYTTDNQKIPRGKSVVVKFTENGEHYGAVLEMGEDGTIYIKSAVAGEEDQVNATLGFNNKKRGAGMRLLLGPPSHAANAGDSHAAFTSHPLSISMIQQALGIVNKRKKEKIAGNEANDTLQELFQTAWHGSPYDFETFDLGSIGTGEGAQVHGWGLYFAGNRGVSEEYKNRLGDAVITINGKDYGKNERITPDKGAGYFAYGVLKFNGDKKLALDELKEVLPHTFLLRFLTKTMRTGR